MNLQNNYEEWFFQSDYDLDTAMDMFKSGRFVYCIFMCHLCLEKVLKGQLIKQLNTFPTKTHNLNYFVDKLELNLSDNYRDFIFTLNKVSVPTRYPEDLRKLFIEYNSEVTESILNNTKEIQKWIKQI